MRFSVFVLTATIIKAEANNRRKNMKGGEEKVICASLAYVSNNHRKPIYFKFRRHHLYLYALSNQTSFYGDIRRINKIYDRAK